MRSLFRRAGQTATFDNFTINNMSGDLVYADPSTSTTNFNGTTANAGTNPLLYATGASTIATFNASASTLTGTIQTVMGATTNVNLTNGTTWNLTGNSTVTNLAVTNSVVTFAPPGSGGAFKTLTVTNYFGSGATIVMNAALGGSGSSADQIIVNGGKATGTTLITVKNVGGAGGAGEHPARHHHQRRDDRAQRLRAHEFADCRRLQVRPQRDGRRLVPGLLADDDAGASAELGRQRRQGAAELGYHQSAC